MTLLYHDGPIVACSTSLQGDAAIALIRFSGFSDLKKMQHFFSRSLKDITPRTAYYTKIIRGDDVLDSGVLTFFATPHSYNGENIVELSVHGNRLNVERLMRYFATEVSDSGSEERSEIEKFRMAYPGEFTYRALKNKKLSLSQVEGLDLLLNAKSSLMLDQGNRVLQGELHEAYQGLQQTFLKLRCAIELAIDFSEDVGEARVQQELENNITLLGQKIAQLKRRTEGELSSLLTPEVVLFGPVNAGKSTLFNVLLGQQRAIVSAEAGTTRDYLSENIFLKGNIFRLIDTAGMRGESDAGVIEKQGIIRAQDVLSKAFFRLLVIDPISIESESLAKLKNVPFDLLVLTHGDQSTYEEAKKQFLLTLGKEISFATLLEVALTENGGPIEPDEPVNEVCGPVGPDHDSPVGPIGPMEISEKINELILLKYTNLIQHDPIVIERHRLLIQKMFRMMGDLQHVFHSENDAGVWAHEVDSLGHTISELIGIITPDTVLHSIFDNFCIGK